MKTSKLDFPHIKLLIAHRIANGYSQRKIAEELNTSQPAISRIIRHADVLNLIHKEEKRLCLQVKKQLQRIENDPRFLAEFQKVLEKELLHRWRS
jgi:predicted transcriptional regulator